jgi:protein-tyrosine sulfotransferase
MRPESLRGFGWLRLSAIYPMARRMAGLRYLSEHDFLPAISEEEAGRLRGLASRARGAGPAPIFVFGVMPRSGTNYLRDVIALHPDVCPEPGRLYEFPLLHTAGGASALLEEFLAYFPRNAEVLGKLDGLALLAGAWLRELQITAGERRVLLKSPHVQNLTLAPLIFPGAKALLCLRDGRDVVESTMRTFPRRSVARKTFSQLAWEWKLAAEAVLAFDEGGRNWTPDFQVVRFEDLVANPEHVVRRALDHLGLDAAVYPWGRLAHLPVRGSSRSHCEDDARWHAAERPPDFTPVGRWTAWSGRRKAQFERIAGAALEQAGYRLA